ncbi:MAG: hypothetical protein LUQ38_12075 [Methanotrichaceae archaeon]|nr:hypothetical protein [Methanotrichaceae archaeon]
MENGESSKTCLMNPHNTQMNTMRSSLLNLWLLQIVGIKHGQTWFEECIDASASFGSRES